MKRLFHPSLDDITVQDILHALSDPVRVWIYVEIANSDCSQICSAFLEMENRTLPKSTLSQHFKVLREAGLIRSERKGIELHNTARCEDLRERFGPLVGAIVEAYSQQSKRKKALIATPSLNSKA